MSWFHIWCKKWTVVITLLSLKILKWWQKWPGVTSLVATASVGIQTLPLGICWRLCNFISQVAPMPPQYSLLHTVCVCCVGQNMSNSIHRADALCEKQQTSKLIHLYILNKYQEKGKSNNTELVSLIKLPLP